MLKPVHVEVVSTLVTVLQQCRACEMVFNQTQSRKDYCRQALDEHPAELREELRQLSDLITELKNLYRHRLVVRFVDAQSILGVYKALRHRFRQTPTFIVNGRETYTGWDKAALECILDRHLAAA
ncbi:MAG: hypothetical protein AB1641_01885 [Thermodesulfobacteriota bacterium]